jgi:UDP-galactopyranose mutase
MRARKEQKDFQRRPKWCQPGFARITEFKHLTGQEHPKTSIVYELLEN